jgi:tetratricopeptide (TPR) repeat protein
MNKGYSPWIELFKLGTSGHFKLLLKKVKLALAECYKQEKHEHTQEWVGGYQLCAMGNVDMIIETLKKKYPKQDFCWQPIPQVEKVTLDHFKSDAELNESSECINTCHEELKAILETINHLLANVVTVEGPHRLCLLRYDTIPVTGWCQSCISVDQALVSNGYGYELLNSNDVWVYCSSQTQEPIDANIGSKEYAITAMVDLGELMLNQKNYTKADEYLRTAKDEVMNLYGDDEKPLYLTILMHLIAVQLQVGNLDEANCFATEALRISIHVYGECHLSTFLVLKDLGTIESKIGSNEEAIVHLQKAVAGLSKTCGPKDEKTVQAIQSLATVQKALGYYSDAVQNLNSILAITSSSIC